MSSFEFLTVLLSVILGLGMANMLTGAVQLLHHRRTMRYSVAHAAWTLFVFLLMVVYWWTVVFGWKNQEDWNVLLFLFLLLYGIALYLLSAILYPSAIPASWNMEEHFIGLRRWFFSVELVWIAFELTDTYLKDHFDDFSLPYDLLMASWTAAAILGWVSANRRTQMLIASYHCITLLIWMVYQFHDLEWTRT
jgi:hypothetical protein